MFKNIQKDVFQCHITSEVFSVAVPLGSQCVAAFFEHVGPFTLS
jgi:hypothetical protein